MGEIICWLYGNNMNQQTGHVYLSSSEIIASTKMSFLHKISLLATEKLAGVSVSHMQRFAHVSKRMGPGCPSLKCLLAGSTLRCRVCAMPAVLPQALHTPFHSHLPNK